MRSKLIIFGATGTVGSAICELAKELDYETISIGRSINKNSDTSIQLNYENYNEIIQALSNFDVNEIQGIILCHRASKININNRETLLEQIQSELNPFYAIKQFLEDIEKIKKINIVTLTSNASKKINFDIDYNYHLLKSLTLQA